MVYVKGGSTKQMDLIAITYDNATYTATNDDGVERTSRWLDVQALQTEGANPDLPRQLDPRLHNKKVEKNGKEMYDTTVPYTDSPAKGGGPSQMDQIREAAGDNVRPLLNKDGEKVGDIYAFKADIILNPQKSGKPNAINTKTIKPLGDDVKLPDGDLMRAQIDAVQANVAEWRASKDAEAQTKAPEAEAEAQAEAPQAETAEPEMG